MKNTIIKISISLLVITLMLYVINNHIEKIKKEYYWKGVTAQFNEERYLDSKENAKQGVNLPPQEVSKSKLLNDLAQLESLNGKKRKVLDTNNRYSLGLYHWQAHSVQDAYKRYYGKKISLTEAVKIAEDDKLATQLTHDAIFVKKELFHWKISMCKLGMITNDCLTQKQINKLVMK